MSPSALWHCGPLRAWQGAVGEALNLCLGTDGTFGPLDLTNEQVTASGVGYKDAGWAAPSKPQSGLSLG